jgi:hypothetical protein
MPARTQRATAASPMGATWADGIPRTRAWIRTADVGPAKLYSRVLSQAEVAAVGREPVVPNAAPLPAGEWLRQALHAVG